MKLTAPAKAYLDRQIKDAEFWITNHTVVAADEKYGAAHREESLERAMEYAKKLQILKFMRESSKG